MRGLVTALSVVAVVLALVCGLLATSCSQTKAAAADHGGQTALANRSGNLDDMLQRFEAEDDSDDSI